MKVSSTDRDLMIIGGGPIGLSCGIAAARNGLSHVILEKGALVNSLYNYPLNMTFFSTSEKLEIGNVPFISINPKPTRDEALEYYRRVALHWNLDVRVYEKAERVDGVKGAFTVTTSKGVYTCRDIVISTGFYDLPNLMGVPGEDLPKVHHYYKEAHPFFGQDVLVVGAANSAVDVALETMRKGARVTMVVREPSIRETVKYWVRPDIENRIKEGTVKAYFNSSVKAIRPTEVDIETPEGMVTIANDHVMAMTGYLPDFTFLRSMGISLGTDEYRIPVHNPDTMRTNVPGIYLAGVICGGMLTNKWFIENSRDHGDRIVSDIRDRGSRIEDPGSLESNHPHQ
jgi:thioredoxin reductase (NADPH)